ncbi:hypothetical protein NX059_003153 [Plenodomus lindquistii]|nr:hypothetical protein NX059_003153 [Plenodomus lindquistii]
MLTNLLTVDSLERRPSHHRSRSTGYVGNVEDREGRNRREREREMKRYHDSKYSTSSTFRQREHSTSDYLGVPGCGTTIRNARSNEDIGRAHDEPTRGYTVKEVRPMPRPYDLDLTSEPVLPCQSIVPYPDQRQRHKRPIIKVEVHQSDPPLPSSPVGLTARRSPTASPHSPTARPELQYQYATLQNKFAQIGFKCATYLEVEAADPKDLTFAKIAQLVDGFAFDMHVWAHIVCLDNMAKIDSQKRFIVEAAAQNLERLLYRAIELDNACARAKPKDLKFSGWLAVDEETMFEDTTDDRSVNDATESLAFIIHSGLQSIELQIRTMKRMSRCLQEATPDAREEVMAMKKLVQQTARYFGSDAALEKYDIDLRFAGRIALTEAMHPVDH